MLSSDGEAGEPKPFLVTPFHEYSPRISPDGRYVAYVSNESGGHSQVLVREFPEGDGRWQVSTNGGRQPRWSRNGTELFYVEGHTLVAVGVSTSPRFVVGEADHLFTDTRLSFGTMSYDVSADGRFVMVEDVLAEDEEYSGGHPFGFSR